MAHLSIAVLPGDGVGPEVVDAALGVLNVVAKAWGHEVEGPSLPIGWTSVKSHGEPMPEETLRGCLEADAVLLGAIGDPGAGAAPPERRPEAGLLQLRKSLGCYVNLRPVRVPDALIPFSALREDLVRGTDIMIVRELAGGLYYGEPRGWDEKEGRAWNTLTYSESEVDRIARAAFDLARGRSGKVTSVDKANVLEVSRLWRSTVTRVGLEYEDVELGHMYVDRAAMELMLNPSRFDVLLTGNLFGDILSDQASGLAGSLGMLGSASLGGTTDLYEPVHGSAPDIAGLGTANPVGAIASLAMMLRHTFGLSEEARAIEEATDQALVDGNRTQDLVAHGTVRVGPGSASERAPSSTAAFTSVVVEKLKAQASLGSGGGG